MYVASSISFYRSFPEKVTTSGGRGSVVGNNNMVIIVALAEEKAK
jgi:hypothetical protein